MGLTDFYRCYDLLLSNWYALSKPVQREAERVRTDLNTELALWQPGRPMPQWQAYSERINLALRESGMPALFVAETEEMAD